MKWWWLLLAAALTSGCGTLGQPPLPKFAVGDAPRPATASKPRPPSLRAGRCDLFWPNEKIGDRQFSPPGRWSSRPCSVAAQRVALGWAELPATQQPLLDQWQRQEISAPQLLDQLAVPARGDWLRRALRPDLVQVALGAPRNLLRRIRAGETLSAEERALLAAGLPTAHPEAFDDFADRVSTSSRLRRYSLSRASTARISRRNR